VLEPVATAATVAFNQGLAAQLAALPTDARIETLDLFAVNEAIAANPGAFGLDNITEPCLTPVSFCGTEAAGYAYFDPIHPTETIHAIWAQAAAEALAPTPATVPLPAGGTLLIAALLVLGYFRRRSVQI
jgi:outer membrane lipase/esterase